MLVRTATATAAPLPAPGVAHVLGTLAQLLANASTSPRRLLCFSVGVFGAPQIEHRGLVVGLGRRFYPCPVAKAFVDGLAASKMDVLHLFLSEACFRVESKASPQLAGPGPCATHGVGNTAPYTHSVCLSTAPAFVQCLPQHSVCLSTVSAPAQCLT